MQWLRRTSDNHTNQLKKTKWWPPGFPRMRPVTSMCPVGPPLKLRGHPDTCRGACCSQGPKQRAAGESENSKRHGPKPQDWRWEGPPGFPQVPTYKQVPCKSRLFKLTNLRWLAGWISGLMGALKAKMQDAWRCLLIVYPMPVPALSPTWCGGQMLWRYNS